MTPSRFALSLIETSAPADRCPHLRVDGVGPWCASVREHIPDAPGESASRNVCDSASLQLWCLAGAGRWGKCHFHPDWSER